MRFSVVAAMNDMSLGWIWNGVASPFQIRTTPSEVVGKWQQLQQCEVTVSTDAGWNCICWKVNYLQMWRVLSAGVDMAEKPSLRFYVSVSQFVVKNRVPLCLPLFSLWCSPPSEGVTFSGHFRSPSEGGISPLCSRNALWAIVARFCIFYLLVHLWEVGRYRGEIAHLPKVRA